MLIVGTGGHALDTFDVLEKLGRHKDACFFNNVDPHFHFSVPGLQTYPIIRRTEDLAAHFAKSPEFILGTGTPKYRKLLYELMIAHGGVPYRLISPTAVIGSIHNSIGEGACIMNSVTITINTTIGEGALINTGAILTHDCQVGRFAELSPGVRVAGACVIKDHAFIGTGAVLLPKITVGEHAVVAAGAVVTKDVAPWTMVAGNPAVLKKTLS